MKLYLILIFYPSKANSFLIFFTFRVLCTLERECFSYAKLYRLNKIIYLQSSFCPPMFNLTTLDSCTFQFSLCKYFKTRECILTFLLYLFFYFLILIFPFVLLGVNHILNNLKTKIVHHILIIFYLGHHS